MLEVNEKDFVISAEDGITPAKIGKRGRPQSTASSGQGDEGFEEGL